MEDENPIYEKYDLQDIHATTYKVIVEATRQPREDEEINIDLPAYFVYRRENEHWIFIKGQTSKYSRTSLSRTRLFRITAYLEVKTWSLF